MSRKTESGAFDDPLSKDKTIVREPSPKVTVPSPAPEGTSSPLTQKMRLTEPAVKEAWHDLNITIDMAGEALTRHDFVRVYAIRKSFSNVDFTHSNFANCYFHDCRFIDCHFTGAIFKENNFTNSTFEGCRFENTLWDKTHITPKILDNCLPSWENVAYALACSLRVNFAQVGNVDGVNKAAAIEVQQKGVMLRDAGFSNKRYYRDKSKGFSRFLDELGFIKWKLLHYIWGNGESPFNVFICAVTVVVFSSFYHLLNNPGESLWMALTLACAAFWGLSRTSQWTLEFLIALTVIRYVLFALFTASLIRRLSRR